MADVWVTGGRGFIGRHLARVLRGQGHQVSGIGHGAWLDEDRAQWGFARWLNSGVTAAGLDVLAAGGTLPHAIVHLAGGSSVGASIAAPREDFARTVGASAEIAEWVRTRSPGTRIVFASSAAVYGDAWRRAIPLDAPVRPCSPYGAHKAAAEVLFSGLARSFELPVAIVRLFSVYGPGLEKQLLWDLMTRLRQAPAQLKLSGSGEETRDFVFVDDAAHMLAAAIAQATPAAPAFNGGTGAAVSVRSLVERIIGLWSADCALTFDGARRAGDPQTLVADMSASGAIAPACWTSLDQGLSLTVDAARARFAP